MKYERDTEWPEKIQSAVFAANTQFKRSTSYTPFKLMFGRESDPFGLLRLITDTPEDTNYPMVMVTMQKFHEFPENLLENQY